MFERVSHCGRAVPRDDFDPLHHARRHPTVFDLLDDQGSNRGRRFFAFLGIVLLVFRFRTQERQNCHCFRVGFVDVFLQCLFDLGGQILGVAGIPDGLARRGHGSRQFVEQNARDSTAYQRHLGR